MAYEFEIKELQSQATVFVRERVPRDWGPVFAGLIGEVFAYLGGKGALPAAPPYARFHAIDEDGVDLEVGISVASPLSGDEHVVPGELPAGRAAVTWHTGPYDALGEAHRAAEAWIAEQGLPRAGAPWEVYHTDPNQEPDPSTWRTEIVYPVR